MKKVFFGIILILATVLISSCGKDNAANAKVTFRKANIGGAEMLAVAKGSATKAEGDMNMGPKALYTVSEDGTMVQVTYNVDVEGVDGDVAETVEANLIISPGFIFPVGEGWLWLANCWLDVKDGWSNGTIPQGTARTVISKVLNDYNNSHHERHGGHYLIRKSDGALFEWTIEAGAPDGMDDGFKQPTFLNGWFHQMGKDLYVKKWGWTRSDGVTGFPSLYRLQDKGNTLDAVNILGDNISCGSIVPAEDCLGCEFQYPGASALGIIAPPSFKPILLNMESNEKNVFMLSIAKKLYLGVNVTETVMEGDGKEQYPRDIDRTYFYNLNVTGTSITLGDQICFADGSIGGSGLVSSGETLSFWNGNGSGGATIHTFDPKAGKITSRSLPEHYPDREDEYVNGVGYTVNGTDGFWECDMSKDEAVYVKLDWSDASQYQLVPGTLRLERFEAASQTLQFTASMSNGTILYFYASVVGADRGKIKASVGKENNAGLVVDTMVRLN